MTARPKRRRIKFMLDVPDAARVSLAADFNQWDKALHPMKKNTSGIWERTVIIPPGEYEYKFLVDRQWQRDPANEQVCKNRFGTLNSVIVVKPA